MAGAWSQLDGKKAQERYGLQTRNQLRKRGRQLAFRRYDRFAKQEILKPAGANPTRPFRIFRRKPKAVREANAN